MNIPTCWEGGTSGEGRGFLYPLPYTPCPIHLFIWLFIHILYYILYNKSVNVFPWVLQAIIDEERLVETSDL